MASSVAKTGEDVMVIHLVLGSFYGKRIGGKFPCVSFTVCFI